VGISYHLIAADLYLSNIQIRKLVEQFLAASLLGKWKVV
jgi:hypothetical protein